MSFIIYDADHNEIDSKVYDTIAEASAAFVKDLGVPSCDGCSNRVHCLVDPNCERIDSYIWEMPDVIELKVSPAWFGGMGIINEVFDKIPGSWTWHWSPEGFKPSDGREEHAAAGKM
jgi:hypothetical protein